MLVSFVFCCFIRFAALCTTAKFSIWVLASVRRVFVAARHDFLCFWLIWGSLFCIRRGCIMHDLLWSPRLSYELMRFHCNSFDFQCWFTWSLLLPYDWRWFARLSCKMVGMSFCQCARCFRRRQSWFLPFLFDFGLFVMPANRLLYFAWHPMISTSLLWTHALS